MAVGFPVKDDYATGDVLTAANMNDLAGTLNTVFTFAGNVNPVLNSAFSIAQRGTTFAAPAGGSYTLDRWNVGNATGARTWSRQTASLDGFEYCLRVQRDSGSVATALTGASQSLESVNAIPYQGKIITISAYVRKGADFSAASSVAKLFAASGTGTNQKFQINGTEYTGQSIFIDQSITLTTSWQRFSATATVSAAATELAFGVSFNTVGTAGAADYLEFTGYQVDVGSVALPFRTYAATIQGELAACQRYYYRNFPASASKALGMGYANSTTNARGIIRYPVTMRTAPAALEQSGTATDYQTQSQGTVGTACSSVPTYVTATENEGYVAFTVASGLTAGDGLALRTATTDAFLGWSAEL